MGNYRHPDKKTVSVKQSVTNGGQEKLLTQDQDTTEAIGNMLMEMRMLNLQISLMNDTTVGKEDVQDNE